jgi:hypothetical protein
MLTTYLKTPLTLERYRVGPAGPYLDGFTNWLEIRGYQSQRKSAARMLAREAHVKSCNGFGF